MLKKFDPAFLTDGVAAAAGESYSLRPRIAVTIYT